MKHFYKITFFYCAAALWILAPASCEGGELYDVNVPEWISDKIREIEDSKKEPEDKVLEGMQEDVRTIGNTDFTPGLWATFSKYYVTPDGEKWSAVFNLSINPADNTYYKSFVFIITNDVERGGEGYLKYEAIRFDVTGSPETHNSQWGDHIDFQCISGTLLLDPVDNKDENVQKLDGKVTLTVDHISENAFTVKMTNGVATKIHAQPNKEPDLNVDASNTNICCFSVLRGSYIDFLQTNTVPVDGLASVADKNPVSMVLQNVPAQISLGTSLEEAMTNISVIVTFGGGMTKIVTASEFHISIIPDMEQPGVRSFVAIYNKTFKGGNSEQPIMANATLEVAKEIVSIEVTTQPSYMQYYCYTSAATETLADRIMAFDPTGMVIMTIYANGSLEVIDNVKLSFSALPAKTGSQTVTITAEEGVTATIGITVSRSTVSTVSNSTNIIGANDNSTAFPGTFSDDFNVPVGQTKSITFTNYDNLSHNWDNFIVVLHETDATKEHAIVRADNHGWDGVADDGNGYDACVHNGIQGDWLTWPAGINGARVTVYVTNCGNGTADVQAVMEGITNVTSTQYYLGINKVNSDDLNLALTVDGCHLIFNN